jgi:hypothetical protein
MGVFPRHVFTWKDYGMDFDYGLSPFGDGNVSTQGCGMLFIRTRNQARQR